MNRTERQIVDLEQRQAAAFNEGDLDTVLGFFDKDIVCISSTRHRRVKGHAALRRTFQYYLNEADRVKYRITQPLVQLHRDAATASFYWTVTLVNGSKRRKIEGRGSHVLVKRRGAWKIVHEHFSRAHHSPESMS